MAFKINENTLKIVSNRWAVLTVLLIISSFITIQNISLGVSHFWAGNHTHYNNYLIFKDSFSNLIENKNLYLYYFDRYADLFKYSPTFAFIMGLFYKLPDPIGLFIWNTLNILVLYYALSGIKNIGAQQKLFLLLFILPELILSTQNSQSNVLLAGLTIITFNMFEKGKNNYAAFFIALGFFIKIYSVVGCLFIFLYPNKIKSISALIVWGILLLFLPLLVIHFSDLVAQYKNWYIMLKTDQGASIGMSANLYMNKLIPNNLSKIITLGIGSVILFTPVVLFKKHKNILFRTLYLALILIWMVVFNYKAESPTFIIAMAGIGIWYYISEKTILHKILLASCFFFTSVWFTDLIPDKIKGGIVDSSYIKPALPIIILVTMFFEMVYKKVDTQK